ncbi:prephenate dehydrogenase [Desulfohalotomaculum tongense]|uniref:prephenate dehydrogenase n=1 Tax=Desulforadius tongensis TaxID=1216062 RepID=UPI00195B9888|nr:prephenate dehydrogenase [Desulforadius tongensis]MBM7854645.1 prephenate dehydrogenase [Desulforadius tongensis]
MFFKRVVIVGVGLIGGSFGLALNHRRLVSEVVGVDTNPENIELALSAGAIHKGENSLSRGIAGADLVVLATPVLTTEKLICQLAGQLKENTIVTDVGSTKERITALAERVLPPEVYFVGGHPMTGSEVMGMRGADPYLFENAYYLLTPTTKTNGAALKAVRCLVESMGARVVEMSPELHDHNVAVISHLPHLVATALVNTLRDMPGYTDIIPLAAGGFRDTTRIAASSPVMWRDIFQCNRRRVLEVINCFRAVLEEYEQLIRDDNGAGLQQRLEQARETRLSLPARSKGYLPQLFEVLLSVPDQPGIIAHFSSLLGENGVNITDLEILRVREGQGGTIRLAFATEEEQKKAEKLLAGEGYQVHVR